MGLDGDIGARDHSNLLRSSVKMSLSGEPAASTPPNTCILSSISTAECSRRADGGVPEGSLRVHSRRCKEYTQTSSEMLRVWSMPPNTTISEVCGRMTAECCDRSGAAPAFLPPAGTDHVRLGKWNAQTS